MIDTHREQLVPMRAAARHVPGRPHLSTIWRWATVGVRGLRLETVAIGGRRFTSHEALARFFEGTNSASPNAPKPASIANARRNAEIERELNEAGL